ncbi:uncharacterized protein LOC130627141 [Hydractinia symbiolongicarpus]|uniref:uncharacterized protein LOC130627141 n=1 Tax=Hydractinia symbiolongicarpus TaxID=13093 RepID=UPI00254E716F|nr:uncharacterized protein LOC130627141 [Hydractinia symbiolongicarpus]
MENLTNTPIVEFIDTPLRKISSTSDIPIILERNGVKESDESFIDRMYSNINLQKMKGELIHDLKNYLDECVKNVALSNRHVSTEWDTTKSSTRDDILHNSHSFNKLKSCETNENFTIPKDTVKAKIIKQSSFIHANRFENLPIEEIMDDVNSVANEVPHKTPRRRSDKKSKVTQIIGDSIVKEVKGWKLSSNENKIIVKSFSGATTKCMESYAIPTTNMSPDKIIIHCGTNDLNRIETDQIAQNIVKLAIKLKSGENNVMISGIIQRKDRLNEKVMAVNKSLAHLCEQRNIGFINNDNINPDLHLNRSRLHLNMKGTSILSRNFLQVIED